MQEIFEQQDPLKALNDFPDKVLLYPKRIGRLAVPDLGRRTDVEKRKRESELQRLIDPESKIAVVSL